MTPEELAGRLRDLLAERLGEDPAVDTDSFPPTTDVSPEAWVDALACARDDLGCRFFDWLSAVDELDEGFAVVAHLWSPEGHHHLLMRTRVSREDAQLPTATTVFRGANWHERETREMFGIAFTGHPYLQPLLLPDGFEGHPLRKDFVLASRVAKQWPGVVDPGQSADEVEHRHRRKLPPGVPSPDEWGPEARRDQGEEPARVTGQTGPRGEVRTESDTAEQERGSTAGDAGEESDGAGGHTG